MLMLFFTARAVMASEKCWPVHQVHDGLLLLDCVHLLLQPVEPEGKGESEVAARDAKIANIIVG